MTKKIDIHDSDYDRLMMRAGRPDKIRFVVHQLILLSDAASKELIKLKDWTNAVEKNKL